VNERASVFLPILEPTNLITCFPANRIIPIRCIIPNEHIIVFDHIIPSAISPHQSQQHHPHRPHLFSRACNSHQKHLPHRPHRHHRRTPNRLISNRTASHNSPYQLLAFLLSSLQPLPARPSVHPEFSLLRQAAVRRRLALASQAVHISLLWAGIQAAFVEGRPSQDASTRQIRDCSSVFSRHKLDIDQALVGAFINSRRMGNPKLRIPSSCFPPSIYGHYRSTSL